MYQDKHTAAVITEFKGDAHLDAGATRITANRTTPTSQLLAPRTGMMHLDVGEERPVVPLVLLRISIVTLHIPTASSVPLLNVGCVTKTGNSPRLSVERGQLI